MSLAVEKDLCRSRGAVRRLPFTTIFSQGAFENG